MGSADRPARHHASDVVPTLLGTAAALAVLLLLLACARLSPRQARRDRSAPRPCPPTDDCSCRAARRRPGLAALSGFGGRAAQHARFDVSAARAAVGCRPPSTRRQRCRRASTWARAACRGRRRTASSTASTPRSPFRRSIPRAGRCASTAWSTARSALIYHELMARPLIERWITLCCVSNDVGGDLISNAQFLGARLADLLREAGVHPDSDQLVMSSSDGMTIGAPTAVVMDGRDAMIAVGMNGEPLPDRARLPGADRRARPVRLRVGVQVGRRHRGDDVRRADGVLGAGRVGGEDRHQARVADRHAAQRRHRRRGQAGRRSPASPGTSTSACPRSRCRSTTAPGCRPGWRPSRPPTPGGSGWWPGRRRARAHTGFGSGPPTRRASPDGPASDVFPVRRHRAAHHHGSGPLNCDVRTRRGTS